jgi:hypothetical protein
MEGSVVRAIAVISMILGLGCLAGNVLAQPVGCDRACLQDFADIYREAYLAHDTGRVAIDDEVRFSENFVEMRFPDGTWHTVSEELGPALTLLDPDTSQIGIFTAIRQNDVFGFLAIRLKVEGAEITEIEHVISTRRNLSGPPTPIGDAEHYTHDPLITTPVPFDQRLPRERLIAHGRGYFATLERNNGEIRGTCFAPDAIRRENGMLFPDIEAGFRSGRYFFNNEVRNWPVLVDEEKGAVLFRAFIDHKGVLDKFRLTDGSEVRSIFREPQSWGLLEMFAIREDCIASVVANFVQSPYKMNSPWNPR